MKKILIILLTLIFAISIMAIGIGCKEAAPEEEVTEEEMAEEEVAEEEVTEEEMAEEEEEVEEEDDKYLIVHLGVRHGFPYRIAIEDTMLEEASKLDDVEFLQWDCDLDLQKHFDQLQDAMLLNPDCIIYPILDAQAYVEPVKEAYDKGFKILAETANIAPEGYPYIVGFGGPDPEVQGRLAAELAIDGLTEKFGSTEGLKAVIIEGHPGEDAQIKRSSGFEAVIEEQATGIEILDKQAASWDKQKALTIMEDYLVKFPEIDLVYAQDGPMALGAIDAIKAAGRLDEMLVIGIGGFTDELISIENGELYGSVLQSPILGGQQIIELAYKVAKGEEIEFFNIMPMPKITIENVADFPKIF